MKQILKTYRIKLHFSRRNTILLYAYQYEKRKTNQIHARIDAITTYNSIISTIKYSTHKYRYYHNNTNAIFIIIPNILADIIEMNKTVNAHVCNLSNSQYFLLSIMYHYRCIMYHYRCIIIEYPMYHYREYLLLWNSLHTS